MGEVFNRGDQEAEEDALSFSFTQLEGEAVFVPSGWQHKVRNIEETLSVNHNWFTAASIDRIWECILIEAKSVEDECNQWGIPSDDLDARETMLRGCIGLNVSMFFLALLFSLVQEMMLETPSLTSTTRSAAILSQSKDLGSTLTVEPHLYLWILTTLLTRSSSLRQSLKEA